MNDSSRIYYSRAAAMHTVRDRTLLMLVFLVIGLGMGTAVILLFAPSAGRHSRHNLMQNMGDGLNNGRVRLISMMQWLKEEISEK